MTHIEEKILEIETNFYINITAALLKVVSQFLEQTLKIVAIFL